MYMYFRKLVYYVIKMVEYNFYGILYFFDEFFIVICYLYINGDFCLYIICYFLLSKVLLMLRRKCM